MGIGGNCHTQKLEIGGIKMAIENGMLRLSGAIQLRGGTASAMRNGNPLLAQREIAVEYDTGKIKIGNGTDGWNSLSYVGNSELPNDEDGTVYVACDGDWVSATVVEPPSGWSPQINDAEDIILVRDDDMKPYQLSGNNTEVNS